MPTLLHRHFCCLRGDPKESAAHLYELHQVQQVPVQSCARLRQTGPHHPLSQHRCMPIPDSFPIPTCSRCHAEFFDVRTREALAPLLHERYPEQLRQRAKQAIDILMLHISQRRLELLIGLSQGYLSRLRIGAGNPSAELVSHLAMLAHDPKTRLAELERYWAVSVGRLQVSVTTAPSNTVLSSGSLNC